MSGKFAVALLMLACVGQVYPATLHKSVALPLSENIARTAIDNIIHELNILIARIAQALGNLGLLIAEFERRIVKAISDLNVAQIVEDISNQIDNIIEEAGVGVVGAIDCVLEAKESADTVVEIATSGVRQCMQPIRTARQHFQQQITEIITEGADIISFITSGIAECYRENTYNPGHLLNCLSDVEEPASSRTNELIDRIEEAIEEDRVLFDGLIERLNACAQTVAEKANNQQELILINLRQCVNPTTGIPTSESTTEVTGTTGVPTSVSTTEVTGTTGVPTSVSTTEVTATTVPAPLKN